jgi:hypothetical protein
MIGILKKQMWRSFEGKKYTHKENCTILQEAVQVVNSRPLATGSWAEGTSLCPKDLMMERTRVGMPTVQFETGQQLVKRFKAVQEAKEEFLDRWVKEIFPSLVKQKKWNRYKRDAKVGDVVLRKDETAAGQTYKSVRIIGVHAGSDGKVRSADVEYKIPGESKFRVTTRPSHKLVLVIPVEEQTMEEPEDLVEGGEEEVHTQEDWNSNRAEEKQEREEPAIEGPSLEGPALEEAGVDVSEGETKEEAHMKKGDLEEQGEGEREPAGSCPIVKGNLKITHRDAIEEIKDTHQALKRGRGRPRKVNVNTAEGGQEASSPGPGKGSVPYEKVRCCLGPKGNGVSSMEGGK